MPPKSTTVDRHAIRHGEPAAGWIVILSWDEIRDDKQDVRRSDVNNKLFATEQDATTYANSCSSSFDIIIKAVRAAGPVTTLPFQQKDWVQFTYETTDLSGNTQTVCEVGLVVTVRPENAFDGELGVSIMVPDDLDKPFQSPGFLYLVKPEVVAKLDKSPFAR